MELKVKDRFGDVEITSISAELIQLVCKCGHMFRRKVANVKKSGLRARCRVCSKTRPTKEPIRLNQARPYTEQELGFLADWEAKTT